MICQLICLISVLYSRMSERLLADVLTQHEERTP